MHLTSRLLSLLLCALGYLSPHLLAYETAPYAVVKTENKYELRDYPNLTLVEASTAKASADGSFRRLFSYISGQNAAEQEIAMTTPVLMQGEGANRPMAFVLPRAMQLKEAPLPLDKTLTVREHPARRYAVLRFRGWRSEKREAEALAHLRSWVSQQGLQVAAEPTFAYFDPPWIPGFLRHNEVMLEIKTSS